MFDRRLNLRYLLQKKSFFLFGPRSTGKTTLVQRSLPDALVYDLLDAEVYQQLLRRPKILEEVAAVERRLIVIDEIQKLPQILDEVHRLIQKRDVRFLLTGSSARVCLRRVAAD
ncbi:MAG TPA: AAA family ATPase, partial [Candidatus Ozemobacteraceae bacterium]|nr:AAA family ATPase [Candidatus Ozemobacteraceae bacterium]